MFPLIKRGGAKSLDWGGHKKFWTRDFPILLHPLPVINDQSVSQLEKVSAFRNDESLGCCGADSVEEGNLPLCFGKPTYIMELEVELLQLHNCKAAGKTGEKKLYLQIYI